jgi:hypothetical protein
MIQLCEVSCTHQLLPVTSVASSTLSSWTTVTASAWCLECHLLVALPEGVAPDRSMQPTVCTSRLLQVLWGYGSSGHEYLGF